MTSQDNGEHEIKPSNPEEQLAELARRFDLEASAVPELKREIQRQAMGEERYSRAMEKEATQTEAENNMSNEELRAYRGMAYPVQTLYGMEVDADPDLGLREVIQSRLWTNETEALGGALIGYGDPELQTPSEDYVTADGRQSMRYRVIKVRDDRIVAEQHDFETGSMADERQAQIELEHGMGLNAQSLPAAEAKYFAGMLDDYYQSLISITRLDQPAIMERLGLSDNSGSS